MIALLTDFGTNDVYVGVMKSVIQSIDPGAVMVDLTHAVSPQDIQSGALQLYSAWRHLPVGTVAVGVIDPGMGGSRRAIAARIDGKTYVGPDNGLIGVVADRWQVDEVVELNKPQYHLPPSGTAVFNGRDIFAPAAAHIHKGVALSEIGTPVAPESLVQLHVHGASISGDTLTASVILVDHFGNIVLSVPSDSFDAWRQPSKEFRAEVVGKWKGQVALAPTYSEAKGTYALIPDSFGLMEIAKPNGNAAQQLGDIRPGQKIVLKRLPL